MAIGPCLFAPWIVENGEFGPRFLLRPADAFGAELLFAKHRDNYGIEPLEVPVPCLQPSQLPQALFSPVCPAEQQYDVVPTKFRERHGRALGIGRIEVGRRLTNPRLRRRIVVAAGQRRRTQQQRQARDSTTPESTRRKSI